MMDAFIFLSDYADLLRQMRCSNRKGGKQDVDNQIWNQWKG